MYVDLSQRRLQDICRNERRASAQRPNVLSGIYGDTTTSASNDPPGPEPIDFSQRVPQFHEYLVEFECGSARASGVDVFTSVVCWESQGGGRVTGILLPLYDTAGATSLTLPALGCCVDQNYLSG